MPSEWGGYDSAAVGTGNTGLLRGLVWLAVQLDPRPPGLVSDLADLATMRGQGDRVLANAAIAALGAIGTPDAIAALARLQGTLRDNGLRTNITRALEAASEAAGTSRSELLETTVVPSGLDPGGSRSFAFGDVVATLRLAPDAKVTVAWTRQGQALRSAPADGGAEIRDGVAAVKGAVAELKKLVGTERARLEALIAEDRTWSPSVWADRYLADPVTSVFARRLIWTVRAGEARWSARPVGDGASWETAVGERLEADDLATVQPWHPLRAEPDEVFAWRRRLEGEDVRQPFKQAFRELYLLTPAEEATGTYSNRFAGQVLEYEKLYALFKGRGWSTTYLRPSEPYGRARRAFPDAGLQVELLHDLLESDSLVAQWCSTDQVRFVPLGRRSADPVPLVDVPPMVFSEAMRDIDLFVSVTSVANDPTWVDRGEDRVFPAWSAQAFGDLTATAEVRRDVLADLLPRLAIADVAHIDGNHLVVQGRLRTYRIHLGTANVKMSPDDQYLCIVGQRPAPAKTLRFVPFEGDLTLSVILSKAILLARDDRITDPTILAQLERSPR